MNSIGMIHSVADALENVLWQVCSQEVESIGTARRRDTAMLVEKMLGRVIEAKARQAGCGGGGTPPAP